MLTTIISFITGAVRQGIPLLFGATGEILTERSGNLNLGIPGIMYMGGIGGLTGAFIYERLAADPIGIIGVIAALISSVIFSSLTTLIYAFLTITLRVNQNVTGLALTTFGVGFGNFLGGALSKLSGGQGQVNVYVTGQSFKTTIPYLSDIPVIGPVLFSYGFLTYLAIAVALYFAWFLTSTKSGLRLRAVGENPSTADASGVSVVAYKYIFTLIGGAISGLGGLYFVMEEFGGTWENNGFGDRGWLAIALVIFALWRPSRAIWGSLLFGGLYIFPSYLKTSGDMMEIFKMLPYVVTLIVLIFTSLRKRREEQPPQSLGLSYFREER